ncbi:MAG TPA: hypothetical protein VK021_06890 [Flavobacteriaceae bacterium]|nr:hypothetical protein [Flavobacteriaceae bacterium]
MYFYGSEANSELSEKIATGIASQWNSANAKTEVEGIEYDVKFRISYETVSVEKAIELAENNKSLKNNFIRVEKGDKNQSSFALASEQGGNSFWFNTNDELESSTTPAHEYGHGLGLPHPKIDLSESADRPHIMIPRNKAYGPYWSIENDKGRRVVNPNARRVTPQNVSDALKNNGGRIHNRIISKDGKLY